MRTTTLLTSASLAILVRGQTAEQWAPVVRDQPADVSYAAQLPALDSTSVRGSVVGATGPEGGRGITFTVSLTGLPSSGGPFIYHIHDQPVASEGNCNSTLAHLDPYARGEAPPCESSEPWTCQVGDLSGKHGSVTPSGGDGAFSTSYEELYVDANEGRGSFFGNRSIVVHFANKTRITCANFAVVAPPLAGSNGTGGSGGGAATGTGQVTRTTPTATATATPPPPGYTGGVQGRLVAGSAAMGAALGVAAFLL